MQKSKKHHPAEKANAGKTRKAGKTCDRKPMTTEQRLRKNQKDRERRARLREAANKASCPETADKPLSLDEAIAHADEVAGDCSTSCKREHKQLADWLRELRDRRNGSGDCSHSGLASPESVIASIVDIVRREVGGDSTAAASFTKPVALADGVVRSSVALPGGCNMVVTFVDCDRADPLSPYSLLPQPVRRMLLRARMAAEIAALVDSRTGDAE